jgi:hypothetical protein
VQLYESFSVSLTSVCCSTTGSNFPLSFPLAASATKRVGAFLLLEVSSIVALDLAAVPSVATGAGLHTLIRLPSRDVAIARLSTPLSMAASSKRKPSNDDGGDDEDDGAEPSSVIAETSPDIAVVAGSLAKRLQGVKSSFNSGLVWFITGAGTCHYVCVVGTAPLQLNLSNQVVLVWVLHSMCMRQDTTHA